MSIFDFDDPAKSAENNMSDAFCCIVPGIVGALAAAALLAWLIWKSL